MVCSMNGHRHDTRPHISNVKIEHRCVVVEFYDPDALDRSKTRVYSRK